MSLIITCNTECGGKPTNTLNLIDTHMWANKIHIRPHVPQLSSFDGVRMCVFSCLEVLLCRRWDCVSSSRSRMGLWNTLPLFLTILCLIAVRELHSRTNRTTWHTHAHRCVSRNLMKRCLKIPSLSLTHTCLLFSLWLNSGGSSSQFCSLISKGMKLQWSGRPSCRETHTHSANSVLSNHIYWIFTIYLIFYWQYKIKQHCEYCVFLFDCAGGLVLGLVIVCPYCFEIWFIAVNHFLWTASFSEFVWNDLLNHLCYHSEVFREISVGQLTCSKTF